MYDLTFQKMYNDWVYLWHAAYLSRNSGALTIVLKDSIKYIPIVGTGLRMAGFVFMSRKMKTDQPRLTRRLAQLTRRDSDTGKRRPMWLLMFPEGTNLSRNGRAASKKWADREGIDDLKYQLIPRSTGTYFCLKGLDGTVEWVYDCTIAYDGITYVSPSRFCSLPIRFLPRISLIHPQNQQPTHFHDPNPRHI